MNSVEAVKTRAGTMRGAGEGTYLIPSRPVRMATVPSTHHSDTIVLQLGLC